MKFNKYLLTGIITFVIMIAVAASGWNFSKVAELPEKYATKTELDRAIEKQDKKMDKMDKKLDTIIEHLIGG